jgi:regulator of sigma E protease
MSAVVINVLSLLVVLGVLVFVHELGHFIAAKAFGIWVHRFALGIGKPIPRLSFRRGETEYAICWLPLGGYVKMASREEDSASAALEGGAASASVPPDRVFEAKPVWKRMIVILAGVTMNVLFAWLVFTALFFRNGLTVIPITTVGYVVSGILPPGAEELARLEAGDRIVRVAGKAVTSWEQIQEAIIETPADSFTIELDGKPPVTLRIHPDALEARIRASQAVQFYAVPVIGEVVGGGPGARAGVERGDTLVALGGREIRQWRDAVQIIEASPDQDLRLTLGRAGGRVDTLAHTLSETAKDSAGNERRIGKLRLGVQIPESHEPMSLGAAVAAGARQTLTVSTQVVRVVRGMFSGRVSTNEVGGPIAIGMAAGQSAQLGLTAFLVFMATISVNLAVLNLLPVPVLDGGQFLFLTAEAVLRRPLSVKLRERLTMVGLFLILLLTILAFSNDIRRLLGLM